MHMHNTDIYLHICTTQACMYSICRNIWIRLYSCTTYMLMLHTGPWALALHVDWDNMGRWKHFCHLSWRASPSIAVGMNHFWLILMLDAKILTSCKWLTGQHMHKLQVTSVSLQSAVRKDYCVVLRSSIPLHPCICSYCTSAPSTCIVPSGQIRGWVLIVWKYLRWWFDRAIRNPLCRLQKGWQETY